MKKKILLLTISIITLTLSSCGLFKVSSKYDTESSLNSFEPTTSSNNDVSYTSDESISSDIFSSDVSSSSSTSSSAQTSSSMNSSMASSSVISSSEPTSSSSTSKSSSSISSSSETPLTAKHASSTYSDFYKNSVYTLSSTPSVGEANLIVVPIWFSDSSNYILESNKEKIREDIHSTYFGSNSDTGWRSVKTYYEQESHGALTLEGTVTDWYSSNKTSTYYGSDDEYLSKTISLVQSVTDWYFSSNPTINRLDYDKDQDGYLDGVMLIYAAPDQQASDKIDDSNYENLWAYCYWTQDSTAKNISKPGANAFFWASYDFMYGEAKAKERTGKNGPFNGDTNHCNLDAHTYIHEMGHMFGLCDYYDYSGQYNPAGGFSMQDNNVGGHDPFSSFALGWGKAYVPTESMTINLAPFATTGEMILLSPSFNEHNSPFDEYLLLEFYTPTGLNEFDTTYQYFSKKYPKGSKEMGIRLWHVDDRLFYESGRSFEFTTNPNDKSHQVEEAFTNTYDDGSEEIEGYLSPLGSSYYNFNQLQLIHNSTSVTYKTTNEFTSNSLFKKGSSFNMNTYKKQFSKIGKLNQNIDLGFSFSVDNITNEYATITITKL